MCAHAPCAAFSWNTYDQRSFVMSQPVIKLEGACSMLLEVALAAAAAEH